MPLALVVLASVTGCMYGINRSVYSTIPALMQAVSKKNGYLTSMKALASVSIEVDGRGAEFPEGIVLSGTDLRLETLNIFYQPILIIVYNDTVAVMDVGTGACSISPAGILRRYTRIDAGPALLGKLITARLPGIPDKMSGTGDGTTLVGMADGLRWTAELDGDLHVVSMTVQQGGNNQVLCTYRYHGTLDGTVLPIRVACRSSETRVFIHYREVKLNVPVDPALTDTKRLCSTGKKTGQE